MFEEVRHSAASEVARGRRETHLQPTPAETVLGMQTRHAKQAAAAKELGADLEKVWAKLASTLLVRFRWGWHMPAPR